MTLDHFEEKEFFDFLRDNGCSIITDDDYLDQKVVICDKNGFKMPVPIKKLYYPTYICIVCQELNIEAPERFTHIKQQFDELRRIQKRRKDK